MASGVPTTASHPFAACILIVEDEMIIGLQLQDLLERGGYQVMDLAPTNRQALAALSQHRPDAVLLDCSLSDGQATPVAEELLSTQHTIRGDERVHGEPTAASMLRECPKTRQAVLR